MTTTTKAVHAPRFANVSCSQCGEDFGPGDHGFSSCASHKAAPTPGPWNADEGDGGQWCIGTTDTGGLIASLCETDYPASAAANARLIAAAPELLATARAQHDAIDILLAMLIQVVPDFMPTKSPAWPVLVAGNDVIAKATGAA